MEPALLTFNQTGIVENTLAQCEGDVIELRTPRQTKNHPSVRRMSDYETPDFVILTPGRSGSEYLVSLLDSHPSIHCAGELLGASPIAPNNPDGEIEIAIEKTRAACHRNDKTLFGFKLPLWCLSPVSRLLPELARRGTRCIVPYRRNRLELYVSLCLAKANDDWLSGKNCAHQTVTIESAATMRNSNQG